MHDSFNLAWKLNLVIRGLAKPSLLSTYEEERRKIAQDLIRFDAEHCKAFEQGESALAKNFDDNIRFISGVGAEYSPGLLSFPKRTIDTPLQPGSLQFPAKVTRYVDANPVNIELDIPLLSQFRVYLFVPSVQKSLAFLGALCEGLMGTNGLGKILIEANQSYAKKSRSLTQEDDFSCPQRYTTISEAFTFAMVTQSGRSDFEIANLPTLLQDSRWTLYLDDAIGTSCTDKWFGKLEDERVGIAIIRPDGYCGGIDAWGVNNAAEAEQWIKEYFSFML